MPRLIEPPPGPPLDLAEAAARLDEQGVDLSHRPGRMRAAALLAGLARHPDFLADRLIAELKAGYAEQLADNPYSAQVFLLHRGARGGFIRANFWPAATDAALVQSGAAAFAYDLPHDHNFAFLTIGYWGPGYASDHYLVDPERVDGRLGEGAALRFAGHSRLAPGVLHHYRAHRDLHRQYPPPRLSVSLNVVEAAEAAAWRDQYIVDLDDAAREGRRIGARRTARIVRRPTVSATEQLLRCAVHLSEEARDIADHFARAHPVPRLRARALAALAATEAGAARAAHLERGLADRDPRVRDDCARWLAAMARD